MSKEIGPREQALRKMREAKIMRALQDPNPFEDAARGRDSAPKKPRGSVDGSAPKGPATVTTDVAAVGLPKGPVTATNSGTKVPKSSSGAKGKPRMRTGSKTGDGLARNSSDGGVESRRHAMRGDATPKTGTDGQEGGPLGSAGSQGKHPEEHIAGVASGPSETKSKRSLLQEIVEGLHVEKRGRGRPKSEGKKPWEAEGISKAQWYRNKNKK